MKLKSPKKSRCSHPTIFAEASLYSGMSAGDMWLAARGENLEHQPL